MKLKNGHKKVLITGTDGFIGGHLKEYLEKQGHQVYGTVYFKKPKDQEVKLDVKSEIDFQKLWDQNFDIVIHTVGLMDETAPKSLMRAVNVDGTWRVVKWAKKHGCKHFIYLSSISVYGPIPVGTDRTEETWWKYKSIIQYGKTKAKAEKAVFESHLPYTILRMPAVLGKKDTQLTPKIIPKILNGEFFRSGNQDQKISLLVVDNLGPIVDELIERGPLNEELNCCCTEVRWSEFVKEYFTLLGMPYKAPKKSVFSLLTHLNDQGFMLISSFSNWGSHFCSDKLKKVLGPIPKVKDWKNALEEAVKAYQSRN